MKSKNIKVAVGLSGGVDSATSAYLLKKAGYDVVGVHVVCWDEGSQCKAREDREDALRVALALKIPFKVLDFQKEYKARVIDRFYADYEKGLTPNPDVWCNNEIKFGLFLKWAMENGFAAVATGHYARVVGAHHDAPKRLGHRAIRESPLRLMIPKDKHKDQTYFLHRLTQNELRHVLFPLADLLKSEVRQIAKKAKLSVSGKKDSQGICFIGDVDVHEFLKRRLKEKKGDVVDTKGRVIGEHSGVWFYTIGQRGGWTVKPEYQKKFGGEAPIFYVIKKDVKNNQLVVGFGAETYRDQFTVADINWIDGMTNEHQCTPINTNDKLLVRIRHTGELISGEIVSLVNTASAEGENEVKIVLEKPQRGVAPGQAAVFYKDGECLGGGVIE